MMFMRLTAQDIAEFCNLYRKHYGVELSEAVAREKAERLLQLFKAVWHGKSDERNRQNPASTESN